MNVGIICDLNYQMSVCFKNYYYAIKSIFENVELVFGIKDLFNKDIIFMGNDHWINHKNIWNNDEFISYCNLNKIKIVVFTAEKIHGSFPWNVEIQERLQRFDNLYQYVIDVDDSFIYNKKIFSASMSKFYDKFEIIDKKDRCVFIGKNYNDRIKLISEIEKIIPLDVFSNDFYTWEMYMNKINEYKYVLSPLSEYSANFFPLRFYETLLVHSIPIHQIKNNTLDFYKTESNFNDCIYFKDVEELPEKISNLKVERSYNEIWLEDVIKKLLKDDNIYE